MKLKTKSWMLGASAMALVLLLATSLGMHHEGVRYNAYWDAAGQVWTICYGHTKGVKKGDTATPEQCKAWLKEDYSEAYQTVDRCIDAPLTITQAAAFVDAAYNLGPKVVCDSRLRKLANSGHQDQACLQLLRWDHAGGKVLKGLEKRRGDEEDICRNGIK